MPKVLPKDCKLFFDSIMLIFKDLDVIDSLLKFLVVFFLKSVYVKHEKMSIIASDPGKIIVNSTTE